MDRCPTCQAGLSAPGDVSKQSTEVRTARKLVIQPGITRITVATAPVRKETAGQWAARGGGGTPTILNSSDSSAGPKEARAAALRLQGRASRAEGQTAGKPATRVSALGRKAGAGPGKGDQARPEPGVHPRLPGHSGEAPAPSLLLPTQRTDSPPGRRSHFHPWLHSASEHVQRWLSAKDYNENGIQTPSAQGPPGSSPHGAPPATAPNHRESWQDCPHFPDEEIKSRKVARLGNRLRLDGPQQQGQDRALCWQSHHATTPLGGGPGE